MFTSDGIHTFLVPMVFAMYMANAISRRWEIYAACEKIHYGACISYVANMLDRGHTSKYTFHAITIACIDEYRVFTEMHAPLGVCVCVCEFRRN